MGDTVLQHSLEFKDIVMKQMNGQHRVEGLGLKRKITGAAALLDIIHKPEHHQPF